MGWGRYFLLGNLGQQLDLSDHEAEIEQLRRQIANRDFSEETSAQRLDWLRQENEELKLYLVSLMRLLISKGVVSREEVGRMVEAVDAEDGNKDGRYAGDVAPKG